MQPLRTLTLATVFAGMLFTALGAASQAAPAEPQPVTLECATGMRTQMLGNTPLATVEGQSLVLVRAYFDIDGGIGPHTHPGTLVVVVESGQFGVTLAEDSHMGMSVMRADASGTPVEETLVPGEEAVLEPGDYFIESGMVHSARTVGDEPVVVTFTGVLETGQPGTSCA